MVALTLFRPAPGNTLTVQASLTATTVAFIGKGENFLITNNSGQTAMFQLGDATVSATVSDTPVLNGQSAIFRRDPKNETHISIRTIGAAGTGATIYVQTGEGS